MIMKNIPPEIANLLAAVDQVHRAFGPPGDFGYATPEGEALYALYRAASNFRAARYVPPSRRQGGGDG